MDVERRKGLLTHPEQWWTSVSSSAILRLGCGPYGWLPSKWDSSRLVLIFLPNSLPLHHRHNTLILQKILPFHLNLSSVSNRSCMLSLQPKFVFQAILPNVQITVCKCALLRPARAHPEGMGFPLCRSPWPVCQAAFARSLLPNGLQTDISIPCPPHALNLESRKWVGKSRVASSLEMLKVWLSWELVLGGVWRGRPLVGPVGCGIREILFYSLVMRVGFQILYYASPNDE